MDIGEYQPEMQSEVAALYNPIVEVREDGRLVVEGRGQQLSYGTGGS